MCGSMRLLLAGFFVVTLIAPTSAYTVKEAAADPDGDVDPDVPQDTVAWLGRMVRREEKKVDKTASSASAAVSASGDIAPNQKVTTITDADKARLPAKAASLVEGLAVAALKVKSGNVPMPGTLTSDCQVGEWEPWLSCPVTCGEGVMTRYRLLLSNATSSGDSTNCFVNNSMTGNCMGGYIFKGTSNLPADTTSICPVDCVWNAWSAFTPCSSTCKGGSMSRNRTINVSASHGGFCDYASGFSYTAACNFDIPCPVNCAYTGWSKWTGCSRTCGTAYKRRYRSPSVLPMYGGRNCSQDNCTQTTNCGLPECPVDCYAGPWSAWDIQCQGECSQAGQPNNGGFYSRNRIVVQPRGPGAKTCMGVYGESSPPNKQYKAAGGVPANQKARPPVYALNCTTDACPSNCNWAGWGNWQACSTDLTCGQGTKTRTRTLSPAQSGGAVCTGTYYDRPSSCFSEANPLCLSDCTYTAWSSWSSCHPSCGGFGVQIQNRSVLSQPSFGGSMCDPDEMVKQQECVVGECPTDCSLGEWTGWSACPVTCGFPTGGWVQYSNRTITPASLGGDNEHCNGEKTSMVQPCFNLSVCPGDCEWGPWSSTGNCSAPCGGGLRPRSRNITKIATVTGSCAGDPIGQEACNTQVCNVDCVLSNWWPWGPCSLSCGSGQQSRNRTIQVHQAGTGAPCDGGTEDFPPRTCNSFPCPQDCTYTDWSNWGDCTGTCGKVTQQRTRKVATQPKYNGQACDSTRLYNVSLCPGFPACVQDCTLGDWSSWTKCSHTCGYGSMSRSMIPNQTAAMGGKNCTLPYPNNVSACEISPCPIDCYYENWQTWSPCNQTCLKGSMVKIRSSHLPYLGGKPCTGSDIMIGCCMQSELEYCPEFTDSSNPRTAATMMDCAMNIYFANGAVFHDEVSGIMTFNVTDPVKFSADARVPLMVQSLLVSITNADPQDVQVFMNVLPSIVQSLLETDSMSAKDQTRLSPVNVGYAIIASKTLGVESIKYAMTSISLEQLRTLTLSAMRNYGLDNAYGAVDVAQPNVNVQSGARHEEEQKAKIQDMGINTNPDQTADGGYGGYGGSGGDSGEAPSPAPAPVQVLNITQDPITGKNIITLPDGQQANITQLPDGTAVLTFPNGTVSTLEEIGYSQEEGGGASYAVTAQGQYVVDPLGPDPNPVNVTQTRSASSPTPIFTAVAVSLLAAVAFCHGR